MLSPALLLLVATLLPLAGFFLLLMLGRRMGMPLAGWMGSAFSIASFGATLFAMVRWYEGARGVQTYGFRLRPIFRTLAWIPAGPGIEQRHPGYLDLGLYLDSLTIAMFAAITLIAAIVHLFGIGYLRRSADFTRHFACLGFSVFAMLGMVLSGTLLQILAFWGLIGITTPLLIGGGAMQGFPSTGAVRTWIVQRMGYAALLIGVALLLARLGNASLPFLWATLGGAAGGHAITLPTGGTLCLPYLTCVGLTLFGAAAAASAQFPLHLWLSSAGDGLLPGSAVVCSIVPSAGGIYLIARLFPILTPDARLLIAIVGLTTLVMASLIAGAQRDLSRLLAWVAISQLGMMAMAIGLGGWIGALFHLVTHAFIIALLFLAAASVCAANGNRQRMADLRGGWRKLPMTASAFAAGALAMAGTPGLSKFYSQSMVQTDAAAFAFLAAAEGGRAWGYWLFFALPTAMAYVTAFSIGRCWMLTFAGRSNDIPHDSRLREHPSLWVPMLFLTLPAIVAGYAMNVPDLLEASIVETRAICDEVLERSHPVTPTHFSAFDEAWPADRRVSSADPKAASTVDSAESSTPAVSGAAEAFDKGTALQHRWVDWAWLVGLALAIAVYWRGTELAGRLVRLRIFRWVHHWLLNEMYLPELFEWTVIRTLHGLAVACDGLERYLFDRMVRIIFRRLRRMVGIRPGGRS